MMLILRTTVFLYTLFNGLGRTKAEVDETSENFLFMSDSFFLYLILFVCGYFDDPQQQMKTSFDKIFFQRVKSQTSHFVYYDNWQRAEILMIDCLVLCVYSPLGFPHKFIFDCLAVSSFFILSMNRVKASTAKFADNFSRMRMRCRTNILNTSECLRDWTHSFIVNFIDRWL